MSTPRIIPDIVSERQIAASDPAVSAWVSANAGSGKTHVLTQRVIRLLLQDFDPAKILCITFTKAAAANMANRVFNDLRKWIALDDDALDLAMRRIGVRATGPAHRARARRLFALALDTPGGLKVQTIHAFCTGLLHIFPFEANVAAHFTVLDGSTATQLLDKITLGVLLEAAATPEGALGRALTGAIASAADTTFRNMVREAIGERDALGGWIEASGGVEPALALLSQSLGIAPEDNNDRVNADFFNASAITPSEWPAVAAALAEGQKTDIEQGRRFAVLPTLSEADRIAAYIEIFCTKELLPRKSIVTKAIREDHPALHQRLVAEQQRVGALLTRRNAIAARDRTAALVTIAAEVLDRYRAEKTRRGMLDYEDLIDKTLALLENTSSSWVHYKLDRGIDHVLIDEAQDTSPKQWAIVSALVSEFFAGAGARGTRRTIFAVGDEKQSIFSFQGAAPLEFAKMRRHFERSHGSARLAFMATEFKHSFRSGPNVLGAVDTVFSRVDAYAGLTDDQVPPVHEALPQAAPGLVELWALEGPDAKREIEGWDAPFDDVSETSPQIKLARRIARHAKVWQQQGHRPGDMLILVRQRGPLFEAIIRALKNEAIPVAGADRLVLTQHIAVMDLIALADAILLAEDDLALATVLKSPLFGIGEEELFTLAYDRNGSLRASLRSRRGDLAARLDDIENIARNLTPFAFYAEILGAGGGRNAILARLGHEAADALDEFLNLALDYERIETPSLQGFVAWLREANSEVKRDMEITRDEVRVMTVHGAKGLEAPIVILADTTTPPQGWHPPRLLTLAATGAVNGASTQPAPLVWTGSKANDIGPMAAARQAALDAASDEYRRLLYVAMTRASERLVVCGIEGIRKRPEGCWYDLVQGALGEECVNEPSDIGDGEVLRYRKHRVEFAPAVTVSASAPPAMALPDWLRRDAERDIAPAAPIRPSIATDKAPPAGGATQRRAILRGNIIHRLMQSLPNLAPDRREAAAQRYLSRQREFSQSERDEIARQVMTILTGAGFAALFSPGSRAEVSIVGRVEGKPVSGQVDRLVVSADAVLIADYKSNRPAPRNLEEALSRHGGYARQLALYRAVLMRLYPDRPVRAALLWTETAALMEVPAASLDLALNNAHALS